MSRPITFAPYAPNKGLTIANGAMSGLNNALSTYANMSMRKQQMQIQQQRNQAQGEYYKARAAMLNRQNMSADASRVQFAHDYAKYLSDSGNKDAAKAVIKSSQPMVDKLIQGMPPDQADAYRKQIQSEIQSGQPVKEFSGQTDLNPAEQKMYGQMFTNDTKTGVAQTAAGARVQSAQIYGDTRDYVADQGLQGRQYAADKSVQRTDLAGKYRDHASAMKDVTAQINQTAKAMSPNNPFSAQLDPEAKQHLQNRMDDLQGQYVQLSNMDPKQWGKGQPAAGAQPNSTAPAAPPPQGPKTYSASDWQKAQKGDIVVHGDGTKYQSLGDGNFIPAPSTPGAVPAPAAPAMPSAPLAPPPAAAPVPAPAPAPTGG